MTLTRITAPTDAPVTVGEVKENARVLDDESDTVVSGLIFAATAWAEGYTGRAFMQQTWELVLDEFPGGNIEIELAPVVSVTSVKYMDADGVEQTLSSSLYRVDTDSAPARIEPIGDWPVAQERVNAVRVRFVVGATDADEVNQDIKQAIILLASYWYDNRNTASEDALREAPLGTRALLDLHRRMFL